MIKKICLSLCFFSGVGFVSSQELLPNIVQEIPESQTKELIVDKNFKRGFFTTPNPAGGQCTTTIGCPSANPVWKASEWNSKMHFCSQSADPTSLMCRYASDYKDFRFGGPINAEEYEVYMAVNSDMEFGGHFRVPPTPPVTTQNWPALYLDQRLSPTAQEQIEGPGSPPLSILQSLTFKIDAKLLYNQTIRTQTEADSTAHVSQHYNSNIHASSFQVFLTVQNLKNPQDTLNYGTLLWFGIPLYDDRYPFSNGYQQTDDGGTGSYIYTMKSSDFTTQTLHSGNWVSINFNVLPKVLTALNQAISLHHLNGTAADYKIGGISIGWENTGRNISTVVFRNLSLQAKTKELFWGLNRTVNTAAENTSISVFPNPSSVNTVTFSGKGIQMISMIDCLGKEVIHMENQMSEEKEINIDISNLPNGIYFSFIKTEDRIERSKFIKE